jgi:peptide methionine sulfoxide reductase MsrB
MRLLWRPVFSSETKYDWPSFYAPATALEIPP